MAGSEDVLIHIRVDPDTAKRIDEFVDVKNKLNPGLGIARVDGARMLIMLALNANEIATEKSKSRK